MKTYLGDGLYADIEYGQVVLTAEDGVNVTNRVYLDSVVLAAFLRFIKENEAKI